MKKVAVILLSLVLLVMVGCQNIAEQTPLSDDNKQASGKKSELVLYLSPTAENEVGFDPILGWGNVDGVGVFHSNLLVQDTNMKIQPDLATDYEISQDGLSYTFHLRNDAKFSDGTQVTSKDVAFTYLKAAENGYVANLDWIDSIDTPDNYTVVIHLKNPNSLFIYSVVRLGIVPEHAYTDDYYKKPIGSGPYMMKQWDGGQQLILEINPEYFGQKPAFEKLTVLFLSEEAAFEAAKNGMLDLYYMPSTYANQEINGMELVHFQSADRLCISWPTVPGGSVTREDGLPVGNNVTADSAIRHAINIGINRQTIVDGILSGLAKPVYELVDPEMPWYNDKTAYTDNDIDGAKKVLESGGWKDADGDGVLEKDGLKAEFSLLAASDSQVNQGIAMVVAEQLKQIGIKVNVEVKSWDEIDTLMYANPFVVPWGSRDPINIAFLYYSPYSGKGYHNSAYYKNEKVDKYIELALKATTEEEAYEYWKKAQWDGQTGFTNKGDAGWLWLSSRDHVYRLKSGLNIGEQGLQNGSKGWALLHNVTEWTWDE